MYFQLLAFSNLQFANWAEPFLFLKEFFEVCLCVKHMRTFVYFFALYAIRMLCCATCTLLSVSFEIRPDQHMLKTFVMASLNCSTYRLPLTVFLTTLIHVLKSALFRVSLRPSSIKKRWLDLSQTLLQAFAS